MLNEIFHLFSWLKTLAIAGVSSFAGWYAGTVVALQTPTPVPKTHFWEEPAVTAGIVAGLFVLISKLIDRYWLKGDKKGEREEKFFENFQKLTQAEREAVLSRMDALQEDTASFFREQLRFKDEQMDLKHREIETMKQAENSLRIRTHVFNDYINSVHLHLRICYGLMRKKEIEVPSFRLKYHDDLMMETMKQIDAEKKRDGEMH
jgi:hypothetical protein